MGVGIGSGLGAIKQVDGHRFAKCENMTLPDGAIMNELFGKTRDAAKEEK